MRKIIKEKLSELNKIEYSMIYYENFDYSILKNILVKRKNGRGDNSSFNDCFIMADTETSKKKLSPNNHIVAFTVSLRTEHKNIVTLWGHTGSELCNCIQLLLSNMKAEKTIIYFHNLAYDWVFIRKFIIRKFNEPVAQLNTKSHNPITIYFENGLILKDSYILSQRSLEKWANDMQVEHKKAVGCWEYNKLRCQNEVFTSEELQYIEHDTLAGVECLDALAIQLKKQSYALPLTATGIPREELYKIGVKHKAHKKFLDQALSFKQYIKMEEVYHGGFTHANRHWLDITIDENEIGQPIDGYDFASSYPFCLLSEKYPSERFVALDEEENELDFILNNMNDYAFMFRLTLLNVRIKSDKISMPCLQYSKMETENAITDNGRILKADYVSGYITEQDLTVMLSMYQYTEIKITEIEYSVKEYLPKWFTDYIYKLYYDKCTLKYSEDKVAYALSKAKLNSLYGMCVTKPIKEMIIEDYETGDFSIQEGQNLEELYNKTVEKRKTILPYQWGVWCTAYAFRNLFIMGNCAGTWLYSDTDSCYGFNWNEAKLEAYNELCKKKLIQNGYNAVIYEGKEFWLGVATLDKEDSSYSQFRVLGAKRYCGRHKEDNTLAITVAGVPKKKGALCLNDNINNFTRGFIFAGSKTGKLTHTYYFVNEIFIDEEGNETADSIDLTPCDYLLDVTTFHSWEELLSEEVKVQIYEE